MDEVRFPKNGWQCVGVFPLSKSIGNTSTYRLSDFIHISCSNGTGQILNKRSIKRSGSAEMDVVFCGNIAAFYKLWITLSDFSGYSTTDIWYREMKQIVIQRENRIMVQFLSRTHTKRNLPLRRIEKSRFKKCSQNTIGNVGWNITLDVSFWYDFHSIIICGQAHLLHIQVVPCSSNVSSRQRWRRQMPGEKRILM